VDQFIDIEPEQVVPVLMENQSALPSEGREEWKDGVIVRCEGLGVCVVRTHEEPDAWCLEKIACNYPVHGCHPRLEELRQRISDWAERIGTPLSQVCPSCDGSGWLSADNERARLIVLFAVAARLFRGIALPATQSSKSSTDWDLQSEQRSDILNALLYERSPSFSESVTRPGSTAPGRVDLFPGEQGEGKGEDR